MGNIVDDSFHIKQQYVETKRHQSSLPRVRSPGRNPNSDEIPTKLAPVNTDSRFFDYDSWPMTDPAGAGILMLT